jgi:hypothetical protein
MKSVKPPTEAWVVWAPMFSDVTLSHAQALCWAELYGGAVIRLSTETTTGPSEEGVV